MVIEMISGAMENMRHCMTRWRTESQNRRLWIGVQSGTPPVPPASNWNETAIAECLGVPPDADLDHPCRF